MNALQKLLMIVPLALVLPACGAETDNSVCDGDKCDDLDKPDSEIPDSPCDGIMHDVSGRGKKKVAGRLHDPLAKMLWNSDGCPTSFQDIMERLREVDTQGCDGDERAGISTRVVSETAQIMDQPTSYRLVTTRQCNNRPEHGIVFSLFGVRAGATSMPSGVEIIAFDESAGVFNFYETGPGEINFFGNSKDMKKGASGNTRRCAGCHTGGGLVMKELDTPWLHWEGHQSTPGASELIDANPILGFQSDGANFEFVTKVGNEAWNVTRLADLQDNGSLADVLRPLFCTVEVNLDNGADFKGTPLSNIPVDSLLDPQLETFDFLTVSDSDYQELMAANGQEVPGTDKPDTIFAYPFIERSHIDNDYVTKLIASGVVDQEFVKDVLMIDFTRPIFSEDRCALLDNAPLISTRATAEEVRQGFIENLEGASAGSPEHELLTNLKNTAGHATAVSGFLAACKALPQRDFLENAMHITSLNRRIADALDVFEFDPTMPTDNLVVADGARLDPKTCEITSSFVPVAEPGVAVQSSWTPWQERSSSSVVSSSATAVTISGSGSGGFNGGAFQTFCGLSGRALQVSASPSWEQFANGSRWTQIFLIRDGSTPSNGVDVLTGSNAVMSQDGAPVITAPTGDCVTVLLKAGTAFDVTDAKATFDSITVTAVTPQG